MRAVLAIASLLALACGCEGIGYRVVSEPGKDEVIRVVSGDRIYFDIEENATTGYEWDFVCDDKDVDVTIDHVAADASAGRVGAPGRAEVRIRIHRGYDGPSAVTFMKRAQNGAPTADGRFTVTLYKRTGDTALWK